jgi:2-polyprenyl-6-methoxyphenol hydroxylase-like FAD-dependent oxidoreductase
VEHFDVAIVGARCAGAPLAAMLARRGLRVCLLDKARFPSETLSTHVIQPCGVGVLDRLGALNAVREAGAVSLRRFTMETDHARIDAALDPETFGDPALCLRRVTLDHLLIEVAAAAGAEVRTATRATALMREGDRVVGIETGQGPLRARLVVGADGRGSTVAELAGAAEYHVAPPGRLFAWAYFEGVDEGEGRLRLGSLGELNFVASPTDAGLYLAAVCPPLSAKDAFLADRERSFMAGLGTWPEVAELVAGANRVGPIRVMANWHGYFREAAGPGWVLLGDAGNFKDPSPAQGMADALRQAERLAPAIEVGLDGRADLDQELRRWWHWRDEDAYEMHWFATDMGAAGSSSPLAAQFTREIADDDEATKTFMRVLNHDDRPSQLFTPRRLGRAVLGAVHDQPGQIPAMAKEAASELRSEISRYRRRPRPLGSSSRPGAGRSPGPGRRWRRRS